MVIIAMFQVETIQTPMFRAETIQIPMFRAEIQTPTRGEMLQQIQIVM